MIQLKLIKINREEAEEIIKELLIKIWEISFLVEPFLPKTANIIKQSILDFEKPAPLFSRCRNRGYEYGAK